MAEQTGNYGGFSQPGARSVRDENIETEVRMPLAQSGVRSGADMFAALLILGGLLVMGRWAMWFAVGLFLFSEYYDDIIDTISARLLDPMTTVVDVGAAFFKWTWPLFGYSILRVLFPITWTMEEMLWQRSIVEFAWPFVFPCAVPWGLPIGPGLRVILLIVLIAPLFTWRSLRDRMRWSIEEFTPFGPINVADLGIDPRKWGPKVEAPTVQGKGIIIEKTDYEPHITRVAEGVYIGNGSGRSTVRVDMRWVTYEQWLEVARLLIEEEQPFTEELLGRGRLFPTHGPKAPEYGANLGYRFFRDQMIQAGYAEYRGGHPNEGVTLTDAGVDFLTRRFINEDAEESDEYDSDQS